MPATKIDQKGLTLVEMLISMFIMVVAGAALFAVFQGTATSYKNVKSVSDNVQTSLPAADVLGRYLDRWGAGVPFYDGNTTGCGTFPPRNSKCITITNVNANFDTVTFYGNVFGFGMVQNTASTTSANTIGCRLDNTAANNCYYVWDTTNPTTNPDFGTLQNPIGTGNVPRAVTLPAGAGVSPNDQICQNSNGAIAGGQPNVTLNSFNLNAAGGGNVVLGPGNLIHRAPYRVTLHVSNNAQDGNRSWLFADLVDMSSCGNNMSNIALIPVNSFKVAALPNGCDPTGLLALGTPCTAVQVTMTVRSTTAQYSGTTYNSYSVTKVYGR
jgi:prepilin-type N-terminal cleavage/methylation domain-containing protein